MPFPSTRSSSLKPVGIRSCSSKLISDKREGLTEAADLTDPPAFPRPPDGEELFAAGSSTIVFQALQAGHCPIHLEDSYPHSLQKNAVVFAFAISYARLTADTFTAFPSSSSTLTLNFPLMLVFMLPTAASFTYTSYSESFSICTVICAS